MPILVKYLLSMVAFLTAMSDPRVYGPRPLRVVQDFMVCNPKIFTIWPCTENYYQPLT